VVHLVEALGKPADAGRCSHIKGRDVRFNIQERSAIDDINIFDVHLGAIDAHQPHD
jgi:hypothetical protein